MALLQLLEVDCKLQVAASNNILNFEVLELHREPNLFDDACVLPAGEIRVLRGLSSGHNHLAASEDQRCRLGFEEAHDHCREPIRQVLGVAPFPGDLLEVEGAAQVHC